MGKQKITYNQIIELLKNEQYQSPVAWEQIETSLHDKVIADLAHPNAEKISYDQMLDLLRDQEYTAPVSWGRIESSLELSENIGELPTYKAPDNLWEGIEAGLDQEQSIKAKNYNGVYILLASILFFISTIIAVNFLSKDNSDTTYQYKSEIEMASLHENKVMLDDNIDEVLMYIENNSFMFSDEQLEEFNAQLAEINAALTKLMEMQEQYGMDESSTKMMARMERDKADLLKSMISNT